MNATDSPAIVAFVALGTTCAIFYLVYVVAGVALTSRAIYRKYRDNPPSYAEAQTNVARQESAALRNAETLIRELAKMFENSPQRAAFDYYLFLKGMTPAWNAPLFLGTKIVESACAGVVVGAILAAFVSPFGAMLIGGLFGVVVYFAATSTLKREALARKEEIKTRLPFIVDLMALSRRAGASFGESLEIAARENADHPAGRVFQQTLQEFQYGSSQRKALDALAARMQDPDFDEIVFAINKSEEMGVPIAKTLSNLAAQMRLKRQQRGEKMANEAEVKIIFPGVVVMIACIIVIVAPFVLMALNDVGGSGGAF